MRFAKPCAHGVRDCIPCWRGYQASYGKLFILAVFLGCLNLVSFLAGAAVETKSDAVFVRECQKAKEGANE